MASSSRGSISLYKLREDPSRKFLELHGTPTHQSTWGIPLTAWREYDTALHARTFSTSTLLELNMLDEQDMVTADQQELQEFLTLQQNEAVVAAKPPTPFPVPPPASPSQMGVPNRDLLMQGPSNLVQLATVADQRAGADRGPLSGIKGTSQDLFVRPSTSGLGLSKQDSCLGHTRGGGISATTGVGSLTSGGCGAWVDLAKGPGVGEGGVERLRKLRPPPPPPPPPSGGPGDSNSEGSDKGEHNQSSRNSGRREEDRGELLRHLQHVMTLTNPGTTIHDKVGTVRQLPGTPTKNGIRDDHSAWKTWVLSLERMFGVHPTIYAREKDKCALAASHLTGAALSHFDTLNRQRLREEHTCLEDWTEFK
ncbi:hypothetical protein C8J55DRAFT_562721 [Lentinula edodes]|uniref:Uncharacterized protein n=1 Tax=Lentinula lateritia TaxID=40482 RepID=A0A9W9A4B3_9AGAR|nr:hypothetical protein C8J55DRAFT_562721 [Lentinula edodes]